MELRPAQQIEWQQLYIAILRLSKKNTPEIEHDIFPKEVFKLLFMNRHNICHNMMFANKSVVKYTEGK